MFKIETLLAFAQVAKHGGFTAAAKAQGQTAMAFSKQVSGLEQRLGNALFERTTRTLRLTEFGVQFLQRVKPLLAEHQALDGWVEGLNGRIAGSLTVLAQGELTYQETVFPFLAEFCALYPELDIKLDVSEKVIDIDVDKYDVYWGVADYLGERHPGLKRRLMWQAPYGIFASPDYLAKFGVPQTPADLSAHKCIGFVQSSVQGALVVHSELVNSKLETQIEDDVPYVVMDTSVQAAVGHTQLAINGLGLINAMSDNSDIRKALADGTLVSVLEPYWYQNVVGYIYYQQVKYEQPKVRAFIDFMLSKRHLW